MANFKLKKSDKYFNYGLGLSMFYSHIKDDLRNHAGCFGWTDRYLVVKHQTIHSKLIKIMFDK